MVINEYLVKRGGDKINNKLVTTATFLLKNLLQNKYNEINEAKENNKATSFIEIRFCPNILKNGTINNPTTSEPPEKESHCRSKKGMMGLSINCLAIKARKHSSG